MTLPSTVVNAGWLAGFAGRWRDAWNSHDVDRVLELVTDDIVYRDAASPQTMRGHAAVRAFIEHMWTAVPDFTFANPAGPYLAADHDGGILYWRATGTLSGPSGDGQAPTGKQAEFAGVDVQRYRDGKVCELQTIFDSMTVARQFGLLPESVSLPSNKPS